MCTRWFHSLLVSLWPYSLPCRFDFSRIPEVNHFTRVLDFQQLQNITPSVVRNRTDCFHLKWPYHFWCLHPEQLALGIKGDECPFKYLFLIYTLGLVWHKGFDMPRNTKSHVTSSSKESRNNNNQHEKKNSKIHSKLSAWAAAKKQLR